MSEMGAGLHDLPQVPASELKKRSWRGLIRALASARPLVVTHHSKPEAVILSVRDYECLAAQASNSESKIEVSLEVLRHRFDERLAVLAQSGAAERLRAISQRPTSLEGQVKTGDSC